MLASECGYKLVVHGALNVFLLHGCSAVDSLIQHDCVWGIAALCKLSLKMHFLSDSILPVLAFYTLVYLMIFVNLCTI